MNHRKRIASTAGIVCLALMPAAAIAGTGIAGGQRLSLSVKLSPAKASAQHVSLGFHMDYRTTSGAPNPNYIKQIALSLPPGLSFNVHAAPQCDANAFFTSNDNPSVCPKGSVVGTGSAVIDARPTLPQPVQGTITLFNAKGKHNDLMAFVTTPLHVSTVIYFQVLPAGPNQQLVADLTPPTATDNAKPPLYTARTIDLTVHDGSGHKSFISSPSTCRGSWSFGVQVTTFASPRATLPPVRATDAVTCRS